MAIASAARTARIDSPWRNDFPLLLEGSERRPLAYLDSAATTQKPQCVIDAEGEYYRRLNANVHRGVYELSERATEAYEGARERVARFLGASDPSEVVFVRGTTEALNLLATSLGWGFLRPGDRVVTTEMEHHSNIVPWHLLRERRGIDLRFVSLTDGGTLDRESFRREHEGGARVTTFTHVSNVLGTENPVRELADEAHASGSVVILDAAQSAPHIPLDVQRLGVDFLAFSGHKVFGPMGIGVLWGRRELWDRLPPYMGGGEMISEVDRQVITYKEPPYRFEAGTPNVAGAIVLATALDYLQGKVGFERLIDHERRLLTHAWERLSGAFGSDLRIFGPTPETGHHAVLSFSLKGVHPHDVASLLDAEGVAVRAGHHCAQLIMKRYRVPALVRASYSLYNSSEDTERLVEALGKVHKLFGS